MHADPAEAFSVPPRADDAAGLREPPHSLEAERSVLGALLMDAAEHWPACRRLTAQSFYHHDHRLIFEAISTLVARAVPVDVIAVHEHLRTAQVSEPCGGLKYLHDMSMWALATTNLDHHVQIVTDRAALREVIALTDDVATRAFRGSPAADLIEEARATLGQLKARTSTGPACAKPITLDLSALREHKAPARQWVIPGWLGFDPTLFAAAGGIGKSLLQQQTATALAVGRAFTGEEVERPFRSMVVACEDDVDELARRQESISAHLCIEVDAPGDRLILQSRRGCDNVLMYRQGGELRKTPRFEELRQEVNDLGVEVLWLDNVAHLFAGDEINRSEVTQFINGVAGLVAGRPFAIVLLAHVSRAGGSEFAGSAAWENAVRMRWYLGTKLPDQKADDEDNDPSARYLSRRKSNYSAGDYLRFRLEHGVLVPDGPTVAGVGGIVAQIDDRQAERVVLQALDKLRAMGLNPSDRKSAPDYLPKQAVAKGIADGFSTRDLERALDRLMGRNMVARGVVGHYGNRNPKQGLVIVEGKS